MAAHLAPSYADDSVELYHADCRDQLPHLRGDLILTDPPYEQTSLTWDRWTAGWLTAAAESAVAMWGFLPLRQFAMPPYRGREFAAASRSALLRQPRRPAQPGRLCASPSRVTRTVRQRAHRPRMAWGEHRHR
jgi:hypothetical protein